MTKLNDLQSILLSTAAQRDSGSLLPPAPTIAAQADRIRKAITQLLKSGLIQEIIVGTPAEAWRHEEDTAYGVALTEAGRAALAIDDCSGGEGGPTSPSLIDVVADARGSAARPTKISRVLDLLRSADGATLEDLVKATGWLPHTTRAALTGLRKQGYVIERGKRGELSCYCIAGDA